MTTALVVGCGSIGTRHIENLIDLDIEVVACDLDPNQRTEVAKEYSIETESDYKSVIDDANCVLVCTPPTSHVSVAIDAIDAGADVFVEKPVADTAAAAEPLVERARKTEQTVYVACNMRFHPPVRYIDELLENSELGEVQFIRLRYGNAIQNWRPGDYQEYYSASSDQGGGVILDAIHEVDIADHWLGGTESVFCAAKKLSGLDIDTEDTAELLFEGEDTLAEIHMDYLRPVRSRTYEVIGSDGMVRWHAEGKNPERSRVTIHDTDGTRREEKTYKSTGNKMYVDELSHFLSCVEGEGTPPVSAARGARLVELVERAKSASEAGRIKRID
jgi:predicted dehydrogenase